MSRSHTKRSILLLFVCLYFTERVLASSTEDQSSEPTSASFYGATHPVPTLPSSFLHVCLQFTLSPGVLLIAQTQHNSSLLLTLNKDDSLEASLHSPEGLVESSVTLNVNESESGIIPTWLTTELSVSEDQLSLTLEGVTKDTVLPWMINFTGSFHLGGDPSGRLGVSLGSYVGCLSNVSINNKVVAFSQVPRGGYNSGCCVPPRRHPPKSPGSFDQTLWQNNISVRLGAAQLNRGTAIITHLNIHFNFPSDLIGYNVGYWLRSDLENKIVFDISHQTTFSYFTRGMSSDQLNSFRYDDLFLDEEHTRIFYHHGDQEGSAESAILRARFECADGGESPFSQQFTLPVNHIPHIVHHNTLSLANGTRRVITPDIIMVRDRETTNSTKLGYSVEYVSGMEECHQCPSGQVEYTDGPGNFIRFFNQEQINRGEIAFQHFAVEEFGEQPVIISLRVKDDAGGRLPIHIHVHPRPGTISLTSRPAYHCVYLEAGHQGTVQPFHLNTTTSFQDQNPVVTFDVVSAPEYGRLEVFESTIQQWSLINETIMTRPTRSGVVGSFTQNDVNNEYVRYIHTRTDEFYDVFEFQMRSNTLVMEEVLTVCFFILPDHVLSQPIFIVETNRLELPEGGRVMVDPRFLDVSLNDQNFHYSENPGEGVHISIEDFKPIFLLETAPTAGSIEVRGHPLTAGRNFTLEDLRGGVVYYRHHGDELHTDSFGVRALATVRARLVQKPDPSPIMEVRVSVTPVNDHKPVYTSKAHIQVTEGSYVNITKDNILVEDEDLPKVPLNIYLRKPRANKPREIPTGYFAFFSDPNHSIREFTMEDLSRDRVIFVHTLNESAHLSFFQTLKINDDGVKPITPKPQIEVEAIPHELIVQLTPSPCVLQLDVAVKLSAVLDHTLFHFTMLDRFGTDSNLIGSVVVSVGEPPAHGQLYKYVDRGSPSPTPVSEFTVSDLRMSRIKYHFTNRSVITRHDNLTLNFKYGHSRAGPVSIPVCINPIPQPDHVHIQPMTVSQEGLTSISNTNLWTNSTRGEIETIFYEVLDPPDYGVIVNQSGQSTLQFSQVDVNAGHIGYIRAVGSGRSSDRFTFRVCTSISECTRPLELQLEVHYVNLIITNPGIDVQEGGIHNFSLQDLNATSPPGYTSIRFFPQYEDNGNGWPKHGLLVLNNGVELGTVENPRRFDLEDIERGRLMYLNDGGEFLSDKIKVKISAEPLARGGMNLIVTEFVPIRIIPVNDNPPELVVFRRAGLVVAREGSVRISSASLSAHDYDSDIDDLDLVYTPFETTPIHGYLYLDSDPMDRELGIRRWTERDIREGRLYYKNDSPQAHSDFIGFRVDEDVYTADNEPPRTSEWFRFDIKDIVFKNKANSTDFRVDEGGRRTITSEFLHYIADNDQSLVDDDIQYAIDTPPQRGSLLLDGTVLGRGARFTQQRIVDGEFEYMHDHSNEQKDKFTFDLTVPSRRSNQERFQFDIKVDIVDDDPPEVVFIKDPVLVVEKSTVFLNESVIRINDHDTTDHTSVDRDRVRCHVIKGKAPTKGHIQTRRRGSEWAVSSSEFTKYDIEEQNLRYSHSFMGKYEDKFSFNITDGVNHQNTTYTVNIVVLPTEVTLSLTSLTVDEDSSAILEPEYFQVQHEYLKTVSGTIFITSPPQYGFLENHLAGEVVTNFTTGQLSNGSIVYVHDYEGENEFDSFTFYYQSHPEDGLNRQSAPKTFEIIVTPNNDQRPILDPNRQRTLQLWAGEVKPLSEQFLNASDGDTPRNTLRYYLNYGQFDGFVAFLDAENTPITTFTQADVSQGRIVFVHQADQDGDILYNVTDGEFYTSGNLSVHADPLNLFCHVEECLWDPISVAQGREVSLSFDNLCCSTNDNENDRMIEYQICSVQHGMFLVGNVPMDNFTKEQLEMGMVSYRHNDYDRWESVDSIEVMVLVQDFPSTFLMRELRISIELPQADRVPAINTGLLVQEGGSACLNLSSLDARNVRYLSWMRANEESRPELEDLDVRFVLTKLPKHGSLLVGGVDRTSLSAYFSHRDLVNGTVCYHHDDSETIVDSFQFTLSVVGPQFRVTYPINDMLAISIIPLNDIAPILHTTNPRVELVEGIEQTLTRDDFEVLDLDTEPDAIKIYIDSLPLNAEILFQNNPLSVGSYFLQSHVNFGQIVFKPLPSEPVHNGSFRFHFSDRNETSTSSTVYEFAVTVVPHTLTVLGTRRVTYRQNEPRVRIIKDFLYSDTNGNNGLTTFTVTTPPTDGWIVKESPKSAQLINTTKFSQCEIDERKVWYIPKANSVKHNDSFVVNISNSNQSVTKVEVSVHVIIRGEIKTDTLVDFSEMPESDEYHFRLPRDIIKLNTHPEILVLDNPKYGYLDIRIDLPEQSTSESRRADRAVEVHDPFSFHYDDLLNGWIFYFWDYEGYVDSAVVTDNFTLLVQSTDTRPGEAFVELSIVPPFQPTLPPSTTSVLVVPTDPPRETSPSPEPESGFPVFTLIPIVGVIIMLLLIILVITLFCLTQQKRIRKKLHLNLGHPSPQYPWSVSPPPSPPRQMVAQYNYDPNRQELDSDNDDNHSVSSGFSEEGEIPAVRSPTHSHAFSYSPQYPAHSIPSPTYTSHQPLPMRTQRPRVLSNVSITLSGRQSALSELSVDDSPRAYSYSLPRPPLHVAAPIPLRPASQSAFRPGESGYNSYNHTSENSRHHSHSSVVCEEEEEETDENFPAALDEDEPNGDQPAVKEPDQVTTITVMNGKSLETEVCESPGIHEFLDLSDPNVQRLFRSSHPVLKKQEYWF